MPEPTGANYKLHPGANTDGSGMPPDDDTSPYGGAVNTAITLNSATPGIGIRKVYSKATDEDYYGALYIGCDAATPGGLENARVYNRAGGQLNLAAAVAKIYSSDAADTGKVRLVGESGGAWSPEVKAITGTTAVFGATTWDIGGLWRAEYLNGSEVPSQPVGNVVVEVDGQICFVIYGTASGRAVNMASAEIEIALATAVDATVSGANRLEAPASGISAFARATKWTGSDLSLAVPGGTFPNGSELGVALHQISPADIPGPKAGNVTISLAVLGNPVAS